MDVKVINAKFEERFAAHGEMFTSPGRINLIGEHTDYNGGFVFPGAIDKGMVAEIRLNGTDKVRAYSVDLDDMQSLDSARRMHLRQAGRDISLVYVVRFRSAVVLSVVLTQPLRVMCLLVLV